jgi:hypothetical protein
MSFEWLDVSIHNPRTNLKIFDKIFDIVKRHHPGHRYSALETCKAADELLSEAVSKIEQFKQNINQDKKSVQSVTIKPTSHKRKTLIHTTSIYERKESKEDSPNATGSCKV